jgi:hypothetical protein
LLGVGRKIPAYSIAVVVSGLSLFVVAGLIKTMNLHYSREWKYDADTRQMLVDLDEHVDNGQKCRLGIQRNFAPAAHYYRTAKKYTWLELVRLKDLAGQKCDYYFVYANTKITIDSQKDVHRYRTSRTRLIKNLRRRRF